HSSTSTHCLFLHCRETISGLGREFPNPCHRCGDHGNAPTGPLRQDLRNFLLSRHRRILPCHQMSLRNNEVSVIRMASRFSSESSYTPMRIEATKSGAEDSHLILERVTHW